MQSLYTIDAPEDALALIDIEHSMDIIDDEEAWLQELYMDNRDDGKIPEARLKHLIHNITDVEDDISEACLEEHLINTSDDEAGIHIPKACVEENFRATIDDRDIPEAMVIEHFMYSANGGILPLLDASFLHQVVLLPTQEPFEDSATRKVSIPEWIFLIINFLIELPSAAFDQLSSVNKPRYALIAMLMSVVATITCIIELAYKAGKERVIWRWKGKLPWFYYSSRSHKRFGTFPEMIGLVCAILQTILSAVAYSFYLKHADFPLKVSFWPIVFALGLFCSKFMQNPIRVHCL